MRGKARLRANRWTASLLALVGLVCVLVGVGMRTVWLPQSNYRATAQIPAGTPVVVTAPGVMELMPGPVQVSATGSAARTMFVARGREADVLAWVGRTQVATITGLAGDHRLAVATTKGEQALPDPSTADVWVDSVAGKGTVEYGYRPTVGRYLLLLGAVGGPGAPTSVTFTWSQTVETPWAWPLIVAGAIVLLAALIVGVRSFGKARRAAAEEVSATLRPKVSLVKPGADTSAAHSGAPGTEGKPTS